MTLHVNREVSGFMYVTNYGTNRVLKYNPYCDDDMGEIVFNGNYEKCCEYIKNVERNIDYDLDI